MQSKNSDYDVRGIFAYDSIDDYLTLSQINDEVIEDTIHVSPSKIAQFYESGDNIDLISNKEIEFSLWDVTKFLSLTRGGNAQTREWVDSPIKYKKSWWYKTKLANEFKSFWHPKPYVFHYLGLAKNNFKRYIEGEENVQVKKYIYIIRAIRQAERIFENDGEYLPTCFDINEIIEGIDNPDVKDRFLELVKVKVVGNEKEKGESIKAFNLWIQEKIDKYVEKAKSMEVDRDNSKIILNWLFRKSLRI